MTTMLTFLLLCYTINAKYPLSLNELISDSKKQYNDAILGNPLLYPECHNALISNEHQYNLNYLQTHGLPQPWFWSRESLDAVSTGKTINRVVKLSHALELNPQPIVSKKNIMTLTYVSRNEPEKQKKYAKLKQGQIMTNNTVYISRETKLKLMNDKNYISNSNPNVYYYHIPKTASSSIGGSILGKHMNFTMSFLNENMIANVKCGFTFVREPIERFVSAYYTVNRLIYGHNLSPKKAKYKHDKLFKWWNVSGEPDRINSFVEDLLDNRYDFIETTPLEHISTQSGLLGIPQLDIHFIGKSNKLREHWKLLREYCDDKYILSMPDKKIQRMASYGTRHIDKEEFKSYAKMMDLDTYKDGDVLPGYIAIADDYQLYHKLVQYYKQDFVCFGFEPNYIAFRNKIYTQINASKSGN
eukprot:94221_1